MEGFFRYLLELLFGIKLVEDQGLLEALQLALFQSLLNPRHPDITSDNYMKLLEVYVQIGLTLLLIELLYRLYQTARNRESGHGKQLFVSALSLLVVTPFFPAIVLGMQAFVSATGMWLGTMLFGMVTPEQLVALSSVSSGNQFVDIILAIFKALLTFTLMLWTSVIPMFTWLAPLALLLGISLRFIPVIGDAILAIGAWIFFYAVCSSGLLLFVFGISFVLSQLLFPNEADALGRAFIVTFAYVAAVATLGWTLWLGRKMIKQKVDGTVKMLRDFIDRMHGHGADGGSGSSKKGGSSSGSGASKRHSKSVSDRMVDKANKQAAKTVDASDAPRRSGQQSSRTARRLARRNKDVQPKQTVPKPTPGRSQPVRPATSKPQAAGKTSTGGIPKGGKRSPATVTSPRGVVRQAPPPKPVRRSGGARPSAPKGAAPKAKATVPRPPVKVAPPKVRPKAPPPKVVVPKPRIPPPTPRGK